MRIYTIAVALLVIFLASCSNASFQSPSIPDGTTAFKDKPLPLIAESIDDNGRAVNGSGILGLFDIKIDPINMNGELAPLRNVSLDDALEIVDITNFLTMAPCTDCVKLMSIELDPDSRILARIGIKHPFGVGDPLKPITGRNRADLHVFNVEGTLIFDDTSGTHVFNALGDSVGPAYLVNADGYSPYLDIALDAIYPTSATLHPYKLHFDDYSQGNFDPANPMGFQSVTEPPPSGNLVMAMGCDYDVKDYIFDIPSGESIDFIFAVGCTYAVSSASKSLRFTPEYQIPQHNKKAASEVSVEFISNELAPGNTSSSAEIEIKVLDINHGIPVGSALNEMKADSSVAQILLEVPGVTNGYVGGAATPIGGDGGDPMNPLTFRLSFTNALGAGQGVYPSLLKVVDSYSVGLNESPLLSGQDAIKRVGPIENPLTGLYSLDEFATYMVFETTVEQECGPIIPGSFTSAIPCETPVSGNIEIISGETITFEASGFSSLNANVFYEWDFGDGSPLDNSGPVVSHRYTNPNCGGTNSDIVYTLTLTVTDNCPFPSTPVEQSIDVTIKCFRKSATVNLSAETRMNSPAMSLGTPLHQFSPAICQDEDNELKMAVYYIDIGTVHNDWAATVNSLDGLNWTVCQGMTGGGTGPYHDIPIKVTPNKGTNYSYATFTWGTSARVSCLKCVWEGFNFDFAGYYSQYNRELFCNKTTGYVFLFTAPSGEIHMQRSPIPNVIDRVNGYYIQDYGSFANGDNPRLSMTRSCSEDVTTGRMYLVYGRTTENAIRLAVSNTSAGDTWTLSTIYEDTSSTYSNLRNPTIEIDINNRMHVAFLRNEISSGNVQLCYMQSTDLGQTFCIQNVVDVSSSMSEPTVEAFRHLSKDWIAICYERAGDIYLALSEDNGHSFGHSIKINEQLPPNSEPDVIFTTQGWLLFAWTKDIPSVSGKTYVRLATF